MVSENFDENLWNAVEGFSFEDITYHRAKTEGIVRIAFNRPDCRNAFRPKTVDELLIALDHARQLSDVGCVLLTGNGPCPKDGGWAFSSGGTSGFGEETDTNTREKGLWMPGSRKTPYPGSSASHSVHAQGRDCGRTRMGRGGGHSLRCVRLDTGEQGRPFQANGHRCCELDGGYGSAYLAKMVGQKRAREIFFLGLTYTAEEAFQMGMVNRVVPHAELEKTAYEWGQEINRKSPTAQRMAKFACNLVDDGLVGQQIFAGEATRLAYGTDEAVEGRDAFVEKREKEFRKFPWHY